MIRPLRINYIATFSTEPILVIQLFFIHPILLFYLSKKILVIEPFSFFAFGDGSKPRLVIFLGLRLNSADKSPFWIRKCEYVYY